MPFSTRNTVVAIKKETTEGTPVVPAASGDYIAAQDDLATEPNFNTLENAELKDSLGSAKSFLGIEEPTATMSHYLRHSGTQGQEPNYGPLLESLMGQVDVKSTERDAVSGTSTSVDVDTGEGSEFVRGMPIMFADQLRPVDSISGDTLTPAFDFATAPTSGTNLGQGIVYSPVSTGHPTLTFWKFFGNGNQTEMVAGTRVVSASMTATAGELINASYSLEGLGFYVNPIEITASNKYFDFTSDNGTFAVELTEKTYKDPVELAAALESGMSEADPLETFTVTYTNTGTDAGKFVIASSTSTVLELLWSTGTNAANTVAAAIGFSDAADDTGATSYTSDSVQSYASPQSPVFDDTDPNVAKNNELLLGDSSDLTCFEADEISIDIGVPKTNIDSVCAESGRAGSVPASREVTISISAYAERHDIDKWSRFRQNQNIQMLYNFGEKSGGNWVDGRCGFIWAPTCTITTISFPSEDDLGRIEMELTAYVDNDNNGEIYIGFA